MPGTVASDAAHRLLKGQGQGQVTDARPGAWRVAGACNVHPRGQQAHIPHAAPGPHPDTVCSPIDGAAGEKHPTNCPNEADPAEIPSLASCDMATLRSRGAGPAGTLNLQRLTWLLITISLIIY